MSLSIPYQVMAKEYLKRDDIMSLCMLYELVPKDALQNFCLSQNFDIAALYKKLSDDFQVEEDCEDFSDDVPSFYEKPMKYDNAEQFLPKSTKVSSGSDVECVKQPPKEWFVARDPSFADVDEDDLPYLPWWPQDDENDPPEVTDYNLGDPYYSPTSPISGLNELDEQSVSSSTIPMDEDESPLTVFQCQQLSNVINDTTGDDITMFELSRPYKRRAVSVDVDEMKELKMVVQQHVTYNQATANGVTTFVTSLQKSIRIKSILHDAGIMTIVKDIRERSVIQVFYNTETLPVWQNLFDKISSGGRITRFASNNAKRKRIENGGKTRTLAIN